MQFRDLKKQYQMLKPQMDEAVTRVMTDANFISGAQVGQLEGRLAEYVGVKHCISCGNGTDALMLAEMALGIGPGVNNTFIDPSFNGIGWNNNDIYNVVADSLIMNPGFLLNFRNEMPVGGHWYYDFTHAFDDRYSSYVGRFAVTLGRFDLGFVPSGENYISINVNSHVSDDFTRYTTTPYLSDGTPLIPAELESMNSETTAPATEGSFELPEGLEEKLVSYLGRAEIFKNDFDKALDQLLAVNA